MHIDRVTPFLNGGVRDVMTIEGANFKASRGNGKIFVRNANDTYSYREIDSTDYLTGIWSDTLITFEMPGDIEDGAGGVAGSGKMKLYNDIQDSTTSDSITIGYSIITSYNSLKHKKMMTNLMDDKTAYVGGYLFQTDTAFSHSLHPDRWNCVDIAIKHWVCLNNVNYSLGGDTVLTGIDSSKIDGVNIIRFGRTSSLSALAQTYQHTEGCYGHYVCREVDIVVSKFIKDSLYCSTSCADDIPAYRFDLYNMLLHELGHAHSLNHVNNYRQIMYYAQRPYNVVTLSGDRNIYIKDDLSARAGSAYIMSHTPDSTWLCNYAFMTPLSISPLYCDSLPGGRLASVTSCYPLVGEIQNEITDFELFPNPANNKLNLEFTNEKSSSSLITISNLLGEKLIEQKENFITGKNKLTLDINQLSSGIYFVIIQSKNVKVYSKFIKQK